MKYHLYNLFANIKNGQNAKKSVILQKQTKKIALILNILWEEGFILGYKISTKNPKMFEIFLSYKKGNSVIKNLYSITKPSRNIYYNSKQLWKINSNLGLFIISTNIGIISLNKCKKLNLGGKLFVILK